jgi:hypothetical protein
MLYANSIIEIVLKKTYMGKEKRTINFYTEDIELLELEIIDCDGNKLSITLYATSSKLGKFEEIKISRGPLTIKVKKYLNYDSTPNDKFSKSKATMNLDGSCNYIEICGNGERLILKPHIEMSTKK